MDTFSRSDAIDELYAVFAPPRVRFCPLTPTPRQEAFLMLDGFEVFFGGAAAGGKTAALLMSALQYADVPCYHALILRRSLTELALPGNLIELSHDWLAPTKATWNGELKQWRFPGRGRAGSDGGSLTFGYLADVGDLQRYAGTSFSYLGFDELTRFPEQLYRRMHRVLRQPTGLEAGVAAADGTRLTDVPVRIRAASNPGGEYHEWIKGYFVDPATRGEGVIFLPSRLRDNPHIDYDRYAATLAHLPPAERERLLHGNWEIPDDGELFQREWFPIVEPHQVPARTRAVRFWDLAATEPNPANRDPDFTVGLRLELHNPTGLFYITDIVRFRKTPGAVELQVAETARRDGRSVIVCIEREGGASGKAQAENYTRHVLRGYVVHHRTETDPKDIRAHAVAAAAENGLLRLVRAPNTNAFLDELAAFPHGRHDDCVDALAGAHRFLSSRGSPATIHVPKGHVPNPVLGHRAGTVTVDELAIQLGARIYTAPPR